MKEFSWNVILNNIITAFEQVLLLINRTEKWERDDLQAFLYNFRACPIKCLEGRNLFLKKTDTILFLVQFNHRRIGFPEKNEYILTRTLKTY